MSFNPAMTLVLEQMVSKNSFKHIRFICIIRLLEIWLLKIGPILGFFWCISPKFLDYTILVVEF